MKDILLTLRRAEYVAWGLTGTVFQVEGDRWGVYGDVFAQVQLNTLNIPFYMTLLEYSNTFAKRGDVIEFDLAVDTDIAMSYIAVNVRFPELE